MDTADDSQSSIEAATHAVVYNNLSLSSLSKRGQLSYLPHFPDISLYTVIFIVLCIHYLSTPTKGRNVITAMTTQDLSRGPSREAYTGIVSSKTTQGEHGRSNDKSVRWYVKDLKDEQLHASTRQLLEEYSNIPSDQVVPHIHEIRDRAWDIFPYPCIGRPPPLPSPKST